MARTDIFKSLCIAEYKDGQSQNGIGWKVLADYDTPRRGSQYRFSAVEPGDPYLPCKPSVGIGEVGVFEWSETRKTPSGEMDVRPVTGVDVYEMIFPSEFSEVYMEDEAAVRNVLMNGFSVYSYTGNAYCNGETHLAVFIPSRGSSRTAIILHPEDRDKFDFNRQPVNKPSPYFWTVKLVNKLESKFVEKLDIVHLDNIPDVPYIYSGARDTAQPRRFLEMAPKAVDFLLPYSATDFANIFFKREMDSIRKTQVLSSGRKLTKSDMRELLNLLESSVKNVDNVKARLAIENTDVAACVMKGMEELIPSLRADILQDSQLSSDLRALLFEDEEIYMHCLEAGRDDWLKTHEAEVAAKKAELEAASAEIASVGEKKAALETACNELKAQIQKLEDEKEQRKAAIQDVNDGLQSAIATYRSDLSMLIAEMGCSVGPMPYVIPGKLAADAEETDNALTHNLGQILVSNQVAPVTAYLTAALKAGYQIAVPGEMAKLVADAISMAQDGQTAGTVVCVDETSDFSVVRSAVMSMTGSVVLVEGMLASEPDSKVLALARHCPGKTLIFSIDDSMNQEKISGSVFCRVAMLDDMEFSGNDTIQMQKLTAPIVRPVVFDMRSSVWADAESAAAELVLRQKELSECLG